MNVDLPKLSYGRVRWFPSQEVFIADTFTETAKSGAAYDNAWQAIPPLSDAKRNVLESVTESSAGKAVLSVPTRILNSNETVSCLAEKARARVPFQEQ